MKDVYNDKRMSLGDWCKELEIATETPAHTAYADCINLARCVMTE